MRPTSLMPPHMKIGFLGAGKMATALAKGFLQSKIVQAGDLLASDVESGARAHFAEETGAKAIESNADVVRGSTVVFLAVKPNQVEALLAAGLKALEETSPGVTFGSYPFYSSEGYGSNLVARSADPAALDRAADALVQLIRGLGAVAEPADETS